MRYLLPPATLVLAIVAACQPPAAPAGFGVAVPARHEPPEATAPPNDPVGVPANPPPEVGLPVDPRRKWNLPVAELPKHVPAPDGKLTVFADFERPQKWHVPLYVVNRTAAPILLESQEGHPYLMLEQETAPGKWVRVQSHQYSDCGLSYGRGELEPGRFLVTSGHRSTTGEKATVRYKFYGQKHTAAASNAGPGLVDKAEVEAAADDAMAVLTGDFDFVRRVAVGETKASQERRLQAVRWLCNGGFDPAGVERALEAVSRDPDEKLAEDAGRLLRAWREKGPPKR